MGKKEEIGTRIRAMRKSRQMTQEDLAKAIGQSPSSITMYETGRREPDFETMEALADVFNVPLASLVAGEDQLAKILEDYYTPEDEPHTVEARILAKGIDSMPKEQREAIMNMMIGLYPNVFKKGTDDDDT